MLNTKIGKFEEKMWKDVKIGNIICVNENEVFPSDLVLINSSDKSGICYIETKNLDGETNLKYKQAVGKLNDYYKSVKELKTLSGQISCKPPNEFIYDFNGKLNIGQESEHIYIDKHSFLLRGCSLKQTKFIYGIVVYTGDNTKIMKNSPSAKSKTSRLENAMNNQILIVLLVQSSLAFIGAIFYLKWFFTDEVRIINFYCIYHNVDEFKILYF